VRGYVSFLVVLAALSLVAVLGALLSSTHSYSNEKAIEVARMEYLERNVKENVYESVSYGVKEAAMLYDATVPPEMRAVGERQEALEEGAFLALSSLGGYGWDEDYEVMVWCGYAGERELEGLPAEMREEGRVMGCALCNSIGSPACREFVHVAADDSVMLKGPEPPNPFVEGVVGVSVYSEKYGVAGVGVFPPSEEIR
jgi:hypothetical protein